MTLTSLRRFPLLRILLAALIGWLWVRSHYKSDVLAIFLRQGYASGLVSDRGKAVVFHTNISFGDRRAFTYDRLTMPNEEFDDLRTMLYHTPPLPTPVVGTLIGRKGPDAFEMLPGSKYQYVGIPYWMLAVLCGLPLLLGLRTFWLRRKWGTAGICGGCGYDLRATTDRCPECGKSVAR